AKKEGRRNTFDKDLDVYKKTPVFYKAYQQEMDKKICAEMLKMYDTDMEKSLRPKLLDSLLTVYNKDYAKLAAVLNTSKFFNADEFRKLIFDFEGNYKSFESDLYFRVYRDIADYYSENVRPRIIKYDLRLNDLYGKYVKALKENVKDRPFYPDANGTLRIAYGKVKSYAPRDGVKFSYFTTLDGIMEKQSTGNEDFKAPPRLKELWEKKDYGQYADKDGKVHVSFIASNHTTGGNSGSPVFNGMGELIGTNFDRCWEGTMSDIMYNKDICRNIVLDVRYTLFVIDKYAGAGYLLKEMKFSK
ncbi:MAG: S46 family peptidase, partial [Bacteroidia bacterium]|nr:S46 family peptidase [Bacteroidia bacterium]